VQRDLRWGAARRLAVDLASRAAVRTYGEVVDAFGEPALRTALAAGTVVRALPGVYTAAGIADDPLVRARALVAWSAPHGFITGLAACHLWGVADEPPRRLTLHVPPSWHLAAPGWARLLRVETTSPQLFRLRGVRVADVPDAVVQSWREARPDVGIATVIASVTRGKTTAVDLLDALARRKQMPRRGQLAELIGLVENTVTSYLEYIAWREVFPPRLFPELQWQVEVWPRGRKRVMDAFDPKAMIDLEFDGGSTHGGVEGFERDRERDADIRYAGIEPLHFTYRDLTERPEWCRQQYLALRESRLRTLGTTQNGGSPWRFG
jgi:hypothetical protein